METLVLYDFGHVLFLCFALLTQSNGDMNGHQLMGCLEKYLAYAHALFLRSVIPIGTIGSAFIYPSPALYQPQ